MRRPAHAAALAATMALTAALLGGAAFVAQAQVTPIYRCGNSYSQWPCPGTNAHAVDIDAAPTPAEQAHSARTAATQTRWADRLQAERVAAESHRRPALAGALGPAPPTVIPPTRSRRSTAHRKEPSTAGNGDFVAHVPAAPKHRSTSK